MSEPASVSALIPAYNEAGRIEAVVAETRPYADEVLVVDDASTDGTWAQAETAGARVVANEDAKGYLGALRTGFRRAKGEIVVTLDADGEHDPGDIPALVGPIRAGEADLVLGRRAEIARPSERVLNWLANRRVRVADSGTGFRALRARLARRLELRGRCTCGTFVLEAAHYGARIREVPIRLRATEKPRGRAWGHGPQALYVLDWLLRGRASADDDG